MHKKLAADLTSLAHSILQMKNKEDVFALKAKAHDVYEKLALLAYVEEYINNTPSATINKNEFIAQVAAIEKKVTETPQETIIITPDVVPDSKTEIIEETGKELAENVVDTKLEEEKTIINDSFVIENKNRNEIPFNVTETLEKPIFQEENNITTSESTITNEGVNDIIEQPFDELENILFSEKTIDAENTKIPVAKIEDITEEEKPITLESPLVEEVTTQPIIEETTTLNETPIIEEAPTPTVEKENIQEVKQPTLEEELGDTISVDVMANLFEKAPPKTLNDRVFKDSIKIDLNDRIAFVKNLFNGNQEDFNRVVSQLNTIKTEKGAKQFVLKMVKPDYNWSDKEEYEARLLEIIERRFS